jgi:hypothetical protein
MPQKILGYDPETGRAIYGYDPNTGLMIFTPEPDAPPERRDAEAMTNRYGSMRNANVDQIPRTLAMAASAATMGAGAIPAVLATAGAGATGSLVRSAIDERPETLPQALWRAGETGLVEGALEGGGRAVGGLLQGAAHIGMNRALSPHQAITDKYGDVVGEALRQRTPVSAGGLATVKERLLRGLKVKRAAQANARPTTLLTDTMRRNAVAETAPLREELRLSGVRRSADPTPAIEGFADGAKGLSIHNSEVAKRGLDSATDSAYRAQQFGKPVTLRSQEQQALAREIRKGQELVVPGINAMNAENQMNYGLISALKKRLSKPNSGIADEGTLLAATFDPRALISRAIREPQTLSLLSIALNELGKTGRMSPNLVRALLSASHPER